VRANTSWDNRANAGTTVGREIWIVFIRNLGLFASLAPLSPRGQSSNRYFALRLLFSYRQYHNYAKMTVYVYVYFSLSFYLKRNLKYSQTMTYITLPNSDAVVLKRLPINALRTSYIYMYSYSVLWHHYWMTYSYLCKAYTWNAAQPVSGF